jgi:thymidylate kinase
MNTIVIGFDGLVRAGKTTLVNKLACIFEAAVVGEYKGYALKSGSRFPKFPPESYAKAIEASIFFMDLEKQRVVDLNNYMLSNKKIILVDRTCLSCLAFDYAANYFTNLETFPEVQKLWSDTPRIIPDLTFFMDVSQTNLKNKDNFPLHFLDKKFNRYMVNFFKQECKKNKHMIRINANQKPEMVEHSVKTAILKYLTNLSE